MTTRRDDAAAVLGDEGPGIFELLDRLEALARGAEATKSDANGGEMILKSDPEPPFGDPGWVDWTIAEVRRGKGKSAGGATVTPQSEETWALATLRRVQKTDALPSASEKKRIEAVLLASPEYAEADRFSATRGKPNLARVAEKFMARGQRNRVVSALLPESEPSTDDLMTSSLKSQREAAVAKEARVKKLAAEQNAVVGKIFRSQQ